MSRYLIVAVHEDLDNLPGEPARTTRSAVFRGVLAVPGVESVTDLEVLSPHTLEEWMLPRNQSLVPIPKKKRTKNDVDGNGRAAHQSRF